MNKPVRTYAFQGPLSKSNSEAALLNIEEVFDPALYVGFWPCNVPELIEIVQNLVARARSRSPVEAHPYLLAARDHFEVIFRGLGGYGVPRSIAGDYLALMHSYCMCPDGLIDDTHLIALVEKINAITYLYLNAKLANNQNGLKTTLETKKEKATHAA